MPDYAKSLGSHLPAGTLQLTVFLPSKDKQGEIGIVIGGEYHGITVYDEPEEGNTP